jgi:hypothetical protein
VNGGRRHLQQPRQPRQAAVARCRREIGLPVRIVSLAARHQAARVARVLLPVGLRIDARERWGIATVGCEPARQPAGEVLGEQWRLPDGRAFEPAQDDVGVGGDFVLESPP